MDQQTLAQYEDLCTKMFTSTNPAEQQDAQRRLMVLTENTAFIPKCQFIFDNTKSAYGMLVAAKALTKLVTKPVNWNNFTSNQRVDIRNYVLSLLASRGPTMEKFVLPELIQLVCRITKLGWFDDPRHRGIVKEITKFLQASIAHNIIGLRLLNELVLDMNNPLPGQTLTQHRKAAVSFRDVGLFHIFQVALTTARQIQENLIKGLSPQLGNMMKEQSLTLGINVLQYDFIGTCPDNASSEVGTIQVPTAWRTVVQSPATMQLLFDVYAANEAPRSAQVLELLMLMASVRRSIFESDAKRKEFLARLMDGIRAILSTQHGLKDPENYHQFCRLLGKLKSNYQLSELVHTEGYDRWIRLCARFTVTSFEQWRHTARSTHYLLQLWARLVSATPYVKVDAGGTGHELESFVPSVMQAYIRGRLSCIEAACVEGAEVDNPLEDPEVRETQLTHLPTISRYQYHKIGQDVLAILDPLLRQYVW